MNRFYKFLFLCIGAASLGFGQDNIADSTINLWSAEVRFLAMAPDGDLKDRFGLFFGAGVEGGYKFKNNFYLAGGIDLLFGSQLNELIAEDLLIYNGSQFNVSALGSSGRLSEVRLFMRGYKVPFRLGKIIPVGLVNPNSGIDISVGPQFFQHKVKINVIGNDIRQLERDFLPYYDRLTNGVGLVSRLGFRYYGNNDWLNFHAGFEFSYTPAQSRRDYNVDYGFQDTRTRSDIMYGLNFSWILPIYSRAPEYNY